MMLSRRPRQRRRIRRVCPDACDQEAARLGCIVKVVSLAGENPFARSGLVGVGIRVQRLRRSKIMDPQFGNVLVTHFMPDSGPGGSRPGGLGVTAWKPGPDRIAETVSVLLEMPSRGLASRAAICGSVPPQRRRDLARAADAR